jgi:hypothetical protein
MAAKTEFVLITFSHMCFSNDSSESIVTPLFLCHHCPGWYFLKHPGRSAKKDTESQAINKWIVVSTQTTALFRATIFFQKESKLLFYQLTKLYSTTLGNGDTRQEFVQFLVVSDGQL